MAKAPESVQDAVMDVVHMKAILKLTLTGDDDGNKVRLPIVIALDNADEGVVSVARRGSPKRLRTELIRIVQKQGLSDRIKTDPGRLYFGFAFSNADAEGVLQIDVNKQPASADKLATKIFHRVRSVGFSAVVFHVIENLENVPEGEEEEAEGAPTALPPPPGPALATLTHELALAIGEIMRVAGADPSRKAALAQLAGAANAAIKAHDAGEAARLITALKRAIGQAAASAPAGPASTMSADDLLALFRNAKDEVDTGLNQLQAALRATGEEDMVRIADYGLYGMTDGAGVGLMKALFDLRGATNETRASLYQAARGAADAYRTAVFADAAVDLVDNNPFGVEVGIKAKLGRALDIIASAN
jgi:hypothetical protein